MDEQATNYTEYSYDKKVEGAYKRKRILYVIFAVIATLVLCCACFIGKIKLLLYFTPVMFMLCVFGFRYLFRYFQIEYKYTVERDKFTMSIIYGKAAPKMIYQLSVKDADRIIPYNETNAGMYPESGFDTVFNTCICKQSPDLYMIMYTNKDGKQVLAYFEACKKALKIMKYYNKNTVLTDNLRH